MVIFESVFAGFGFTENLIDRKILRFYTNDKSDFISKSFRYEKSIIFFGFSWKISFNQKKVELTTLIFNLR